MHIIYCTLYICYHIIHNIYIYYRFYMQYNIYILYIYYDILYMIYYIFDISILQYIYIYIYHIHILYCFGTRRVLQVMYSVHVTKFAEPFLSSLLPWCKCLSSSGEAKYCCFLVVVFNFYFYFVLVVVCLVFY